MDVIVNRKRTKAKFSGTDFKGMSTYTVNDVKLVIRIPILYKRIRIEETKILFIQQLEFFFK